MIIKYKMKDIFIFIIGISVGMLLCLCLNPCKGSLTQECSMSTCSTLFTETRDELSIFHPDIINRKVELYKGKELLADDILYGYDLLFEKDLRFEKATWLGAQTQQNPSDSFVLQGLLWQIKPDLIIDLGTNIGGSAIFFASIMNYYNKNGKIITIDRRDYTKSWAEGRKLCKDCIKPDESPLWKQHVTFYQSSTTDPEILKIVEEHVNAAKVVFINQDASHDALDVYADLLAYSKFVSIGSYIIVQDTKLDRMFRLRNLVIPQNENFTAPPIIPQVEKFVKENGNFIIDRDQELFYYFTHHPMGYLKRIK